MLEVRFDAPNDVLFVPVEEEVRDNRPTDKVFPLPYNVVIPFIPVSPASEVLVPPRLMEVVPMVIEEFANPAFGIVVLAVTALLPFAYT